MPSRPSTLKDLKNSGWARRSVREEIRTNLIAALRDGRTLFPGIVGYDDTVIPQIVNALLAGHDLILIGLRGQAKTRILRSLTAFLDPEIPILAGAPLNDDPFAPASTEGRRLIAEQGDAAKIKWWPREARYQEKLATPDVSMADLMGDIDPIRAAARGESILDDEAVAYGILPRTNRGIFAVNELPDLAPRIQVALLNVMEERDIQIRGFPIRIPLDILLVFSANPEDYTRRGNLITPLRDRIAAQIHTHYPRTLEDGMAVTAQESWVEREGFKIQVPHLARELVEEVARSARQSDWVDQTSGVSARLTIALMETVISNAERRALASGHADTCVRLSDFFAATSAISGKVELVFEGEREGPERVATHLVGQAAKAVFDRRFPDFFAQDENDSPYGPIADYFRDGGETITDDRETDARLFATLIDLPGLQELLDAYLVELEEGAEILGAEIVLEGLHQHSVLSKDQSSGQSAYTDMVAGMWEDIDGKGPVR
ncbi:MAG: magnesium chelatase [Planctomycetes bacterium]|nr:magnesium chelatase [Planctomycetota bacterium]